MVHEAIAGAHLPLGMRIRPQLKTIRGVEIQMAVEKYGIPRGSVSHLCCPQVLTSV
jgi:hypothetical protein